VHCGVFVRFTYILFAVRLIETIMRGTVIVGTEKGIMTL
jgi:hypothetical protein